MRLLSAVSLHITHLTPIDVVIFNFTDKNLHNNSSDLSFIYDATVREILRQDVRSVLRKCQTMQRSS